MLHFGGVDFVFEPLPEDTVDNAGLSLDFSFPVDILLCLAKSRRRPDLVGVWRMLAVYFDVIPVAEGTRLVL